MRFLYLGPFRFPNGDAAASRVLNNARIIRDLGHDVRILSFGGKYLSEDRTSEGYFYDGFEYFISNDIDTHTWKERISRYTFPNPSSCKLLYKWRKDFDVIITYNTTLLFNINLLLFCWRYKKKLILDLTEWPAANETIGGVYSPLFWLSELNIRVIQKFFRNKILISRFLFEYYKSYNKIILPPLISITDNKWNTFVSIYDSRIVNHKGLRIIFAGTPAKKDLLANLIKAIFVVLRDGLDIQLVVAGVSQEQGVSFVSDVSKLKEYNRNIIFLGRIPQENIPSYYKISDFSAIIRVPSRKNMAGFPTKMAESMAAGCPVLMNLTSDLEDYALDGKNAIIIDDYKVDSIVQGLNRIVNLSAKERQDMKSNARRIGETKFDYKNYKNMMRLFINNIK